MNVSFSELYFKLENCGVEESSLNGLYFEQALEPFVSQKFSVEEFLSELLSQAQYSEADQDRMRRVLEPYEGAKVFVSKQPLSLMIEAASRKENAPGFGVFQIAEQHLDSGR